MGIRTTDAGGEPRGSRSGHVQQREDEVPQRIDGAGERVDAGDDGEPVAHRPDSSARGLAERHSAGGPAAGYGRVLVNGTLSVKASFAGHLFRLHRQSAGCQSAGSCGCSCQAGLARRPLRGLGHTGPLEQRAPGPESNYAAAPAITAASAPAGSGRRLSRQPRRVCNDRHIRPTPAAVSRRCSRLSAFQAPLAPRFRESTSESSCSVFARG